MATKKKASTGKKAGTSAGKGATKATVKAKATSKGQSAVKAAPASKKPAPVKLNDRQRALLQQVKDAGDAGYTIGKAAEQRSIDALLERKLLKKAAKNKTTGKTPYLLTKAARQHLPAATPAPIATPEPAAVSAPAPAAAPAPPVAEAPAPPPAM